MAIARIDLRTGLPKARAIFDQLTPGSCSYLAPCVIGAMVPEDKRAIMDATRTGHISALISNGHVKAPKEQFDDIIRLQVVFDSGSAKRFREVFAELEAKYAPQASS